MDNFVDERDFKLLECDTYTFFVIQAKKSTHYDVSARKLLPT